MFCIKCAQELPDEANFCSGCGQAVTARAGRSASLPVVFDPGKTEITSQTPAAMPTDRALPEVEGEEVAFRHIQTPQPALLIDLLKQAEDLLSQAGRDPPEHLASVFALCARALSIDPHYADFYVIKGDALVIAHRYAEAITAYDEAIRLGATSASVYNVKAYALAQKALLLYMWAREHEAYEEFIDAVFLPLCDEVSRLDPNIGTHYHYNTDDRRSPYETESLFDEWDIKVGGSRYNPLRHGSKAYKTRLHELVANKRQEEEEEEEKQRRDAVEALSQTPLDFSFSRKRY